MSEQESGYKPHAAAPLHLGQNAITASVRGASGNQPQRSGFEGSCGERACPSRSSILPEGLLCGAASLSVLLAFIFLRRD